MPLNEIIMSLEVGLIYGIVAVGVYLTFRVINFADLTCDGSFVLGSSVVGAMINSNQNPWLSLFVAMLSGGISGCITGLLHTKYKVADLLSGILVSFMLYSINLRIMGGIPNISLIGHHNILHSSPVVTLFIIGFVLCCTITCLLVTDFGLALRSIGQNKKLASNSGINVAFMTILGLALSNAVIALGGGLFSQHQYFADVGSGTGTIIVALASLMIGECLMKKRSIIIKITSCLVGSIAYRLLINLSLHSNHLCLTTTDLNLVTGLMIVVIMYIQKPRARSMC